MRSAAAVTGVVIASFFAIPTAQAVPACSAADISVNEPLSCPASATEPCLILDDYEIADGCVVDFGTRDVTIGSGSRIDVFGGIMTWLTGPFTMEANSELRGRGDNSLDTGGDILLAATGDVRILGGGIRAKVDVSAGDAAGDIVISTTGQITVGGRLLANASSVDSGNGKITLIAAGDIVLESTGQLSATGGSQFFAGSVELTSQSNIDLLGTVDLSGGEAGDIEVSATGSVEIEGPLTLTASGDATTGGAVMVNAGGDISLDERIRANGTSGADGFAGDGGRVDMTSLGGDIFINENIIIDGAGPDGFGDGLDLVAAGRIVIASTSTISSQGAIDGEGGAIVFIAGTDVVVNGNINTSGGDTGGSVDIEAGRDVTITAPLEVQGRASAGFAGEIFVEAGLRTTGTLTIDSRLDAAGGGCNVTEGCGLGGTIDARGCLVLVNSAARVLANGPEGGSILLSSRGLMVAQVGSNINADASLALGADGSVEIQTATGAAPTLLGTVVPAPLLTTSLLPRCGFCGNGTVDPGESCDDGNTDSCDGCSWFCQGEACDDGESCTNDSCNPAHGCVHLALLDNTTCNDGRFCTASDVCDDGECQGTPIACAPSNDPCQVAICSESAQGCDTVPVPDGSSCDDANACTVADACLAGVCGGQPMVCAPGSACVLGECVLASTELVLGVAEEGLSAAQGESLNFFVDLQFNSPRLRIASFNGTGNADVYLRRGAVPTLDEFDCASTKPDNFDKCLLGATQADMYHVLLYATDDFDGVSIAASTTGSCTLSVVRTPAGKSAAMLFVIVGVLFLRRRKRRRRLNAVRR